MRYQRSLTARGWAMLAAVTLASSVSCTSGEADDASTNSSHPPVVAPGKPGEQARTLSPKDATKARPKNRHNSADTAYVQDMIGHHRQALEMTALADKHAKAKDVRRIAERIDSAQKPEIDVMAAWLKERGEPPKRPGHQHSTMAGMASREQLDALGRARGKAFDTLFLKLMITHHQGAVTMATGVLSQGNDVLVEEMANEVIAQQSTEIDRMRDM